MGEKHSGGGGGGIFFFSVNVGAKIPWFPDSPPLLSSPPSVQGRTHCYQNIIHYGADSLIGGPGTLRKAVGNFRHCPAPRGGKSREGEEGWGKKNEGENEREERRFIMRALFFLLFFEVVSEDWWTEERWRGRGLSENPVAPWLCVLFLQVTIQSLWSQFCWLFEIISCHSTEKVPGIRQIINSFIISRPRHFHVRYVIFYTTVMQWMLRILYLIYLT